MNVTKAATCSLVGWFHRFATGKLEVQVVGFECRYSKCSPTLIAQRIEGQGFNAEIPNVVAAVRVQGFRFC